MCNLKNLNWLLDSLLTLERGLLSVSRACVDVLPTRTLSVSVTGLCNVPPPPPARDNQTCSRNVGVSVVACFCMWGGSAQLTGVIGIKNYGIPVGDLE